MIASSESTFKDTTPAWLKAVGWQIAHGPNIAPDVFAAERADYNEVVLIQNLRDTLPPKLISGEVRVEEARKYMRKIV